MLLTALFRMKFLFSCIVKKFFSLPKGSYKIKSIIKLFIYFYIFLTNSGKINPGFLLKRSFWKVVLVLFYFILKGARLRHPNLTEMLALFCWSSQNNVARAPKYTTASRSVELLRCRAGMVGPFRTELSSCHEQVPAPAGSELGIWDMGWRKGEKKGKGSGVV